MFSRMVRPLIGFAIFSVSFVLALGFVSADTNLIQNPGFELAGTNGDPVNWKRTYWGSPAPTFTYPVVGRTGKAVSIAFGSNSSGDARYQHDAVAVSPGSSYTYSVWYKSTAQTEINLVYTSTSGALSYGWLSTLPSSGGAWKQATISFTAPSSAQKVSVYMLLDRVGSLIIDDVSLSTGSVTPPPPPPPPPGGFSEGMVTFSFDDSWSSQLSALPLLEAAGFKGTFYLTTQPIQEGWDGFMTPAQAKDIAVRGHEVAGHTITHADLTTLSRTKITRELKNSKTYLESLIGKNVVSFAYPYGALNSTVKSLVSQAGYTNARGIEYDVLNTATSDKLNLKSQCLETSMPIAQVKTAIDAAKANKQWYVLCLHEVKDGGDQYSITPAKLKEIIDYVKASGVKVVTVQEGRALMQ